MNRLLLLMLLLFAGPHMSFSQPEEGYWRVHLKRQQEAPGVWMVMQYQRSQGWQVINEGEVLQTVNLRKDADSIRFDMPVFESAFSFSLKNPQYMEGHWTKGTGAGYQVWQATAMYTGDDKSRFGFAETVTDTLITGRWAFDIIRVNGTHRPAIGDLVMHEGGLVTGTIRTPAGDYRYLDGLLRYDSLFLGTFDGGHAYYFAMRYTQGEGIEDGLFYQGSWPPEYFTVSKNANAALPPSDDRESVPEGLDPFSFCFQDIDGKKVCLSDERFAGKAVVIQIMGSWCPNCMDETAYLSQWYREERPKDVEVLALAYELTTDMTRSARSLSRFRDRFTVPYPMLITGVPVGDNLKTAKTLPGLPEINIFPTTLFLDKNKKLHGIHSGFYGPASPAEFEAFKAGFSKKVQEARVN